MPGNRRRTKRPPRARTRSHTPAAPPPRPKTRERESDAYVSLRDRFLEAERATRSTLQVPTTFGYGFGRPLDGLEGDFDAVAPPYLFNGDNLLYRTADGYVGTGISALDFTCVAVNRAYWRREFGCSLPTRADMGGVDPD